MNISNLKLDLIKTISETDDVALLNKINEIMDYLMNSENNNSSINEPTSTYEKADSEKVYVFNEWQQKRIDKALEQYKNGECISDEEAQKEIQTWLED